MESCNTRSPEWVTLTFIPFPRRSRDCNKLQRQWCGRVHVQNWNGRGMVGLLLCLPYLLTIMECIWLENLRTVGSSMGNIGIAPETLEYADNPFPLGAPYVALALSITRISVLGVIWYDQWWQSPNSSTRHQWLWSLRLSYAAVAPMYCIRHDSNENEWYAVYGISSTWAKIAAIPQREQYCFNFEIWIIVKEWQHWVISSTKQANK